MAQTAKTRNASVPQPPPFKVSRVFHAPRETVFKAWTSAGHVRRWFSPETVDITHAQVDPHIGGRFEVCMRLPDGAEHWTRGTFAEFVPLTRLVVDTQVSEGDGTPIFRAYTEVDFADALGGTRVDVVQTYTFADPSIAAAYVAGAPEGWGSTLDKLEKEVIRMRGGAGTGARSVVHATFHLERTYDAPAARVWKALTDPAAKAKWFGGTAGRWEILERHMDVRPGGTERLKGRWEGGLVSTFDATYHDVIANERLVYSYEMHMDDKKISVSLATMQLKPAGGTTTLAVTEQGAFLDGYDDAGSREHGTGHLLDALGASLKD
ncbi:MAG TPA: SRPBCC family protein [Stellaceae bacterium]|nr:SRPBCC family protein [Stellaceae bacterium]